MQLIVSVQKGNLHKSNRERAVMRLSSIDTDFTVCVLMCLLSHVHLLTTPPEEVGVSQRLAKDESDANTSLLLIREEKRLVLWPKNQNKGLFPHIQLPSHPK